MPKLGQGYRHAQVHDTPTMQIFAHTSLPSPSRVTNFRHVPKNEQLLPTKQVAELLRVDVRTVHRMAEDGRLPPALKLPGTTGAWLFERADVERIADQRAAA